MLSAADPELLYASKEPDIAYLSQTFKQTQSDLGEWLDRRQRDYDVRNCQWAGKSDDFKKHSSQSSTGEVFPWNGASDQEVRLADELIGCRVSMVMNAVRRAHIVATPTESNDVERASVISNFLRWLINSKMPEFYSEVELGLNNLFEKGMMVHYAWYEQQELKQQQTIKLEEIAQVLPAIAEAIQDGSMDEELSETLKEQFGVSKAKGRAMLRELRKDGETTVPVTRQVVSRPKIRALAPDEDVFWPNYTIDPQSAPYVFHQVNMTPEQIRAKINSEDWDKDFVEQVVDLANNAQTNDNLYNAREESEFMRADDQYVKIVYCYQRLLDEDDVPGIFCTVMHPALSDVYAKHQLLDYSHGQYPFIVTTLEKTSKRLYSSRSYPELIESLQQVLKVETDSAIDAQSLTTLPPIEYPMGRLPARFGPGVKIPYRTPGEVRFADTPRGSTVNVELRRYIKEQADRYFGRNAPGVDPIEAQMKQQEIIDKVFQHLKHVLDQVFSLYQQYGPDEEYFRVTGVQDMKKFSKGEAGERFDFYLQFDAALQDPAQMLERVKAIAELGGMLDKNGVLDTEQLLTIAVGQILPGAADSIMIPKETASQKAVEEERQTITEIYAGVPPNVRPNDSHEMKLQIFQQWLAQPDIAQKVQQDPALQERISQYLKQRQFAVTQRQNAEIGRLGATPTEFGETPTAAA
jgi:hypothetical protein